MMRAEAFLGLALSAAVALVCCGDDVDFSNNSNTSNGSSTTANGVGGSAGASSGSGGNVGVGGSPGTGGAGGMPVTNNGFPAKWNDGTNCGNEAPIQRWKYADDTFILRQSLCSNFEGPFVYVLLGTEAVFVQDTGTGAVDLYTPIATIVAEWSAARGLGTLPIYVTHSHGHGDHTGGDGQFSGKPDVTVVGTSSNAVQNFFGFSNWPTETVTLDLGERTLDVMGLPGHQAAHVAIYDRKHELLLTGDTLYPGRLYISNWPQYQASIARMVDFAGAGNPVQWVLGTHIEMKAVGGDFPFGSTSHPDEHVLQLPFGVLTELNQAVIAMGNNPTQEEHADFIIYP